MRARRLAVARDPRRPTNRLDVDTIEWLETYLRDEFRGALPLITHDRYVLDRVVTRTLEIDALALERGGARLIDGLELRVNAGQRIGVIGPNGSGKTSLLLAILGELESG